MRVLGVSGLYHDAAVALVDDGVPVLAAAEERFSRVKHDSRLPSGALRWLASEPEAAGGVDAVVFYERPLARLDRIQHMRRGRVAGWGKFHRVLRQWSSSKLWVQSGLLTEVEQSGLVAPEEVLFCDHHRSHAASAFFPSPFERAAVVCLDGVGEWVSSSVAYGEGDRLELKAHGVFPHSIGLFYAAMTSLAGFKVNSGEYKVMGLAPYGQPRFVDRLLGEVIRVDDDGGVTLNLAYFSFGETDSMVSPKLLELLFAAQVAPVMAREGVPTEVACDLAASTQAVCDLVLERTIRFATRVTKCADVALAGGVALNGVALQRALEVGAARDVFVQPAASDAGGALGAALALCADRGCLQRPWVPSSDGMSLGFLGPGIDPVEVDAVLDRFGVARVYLERAQMDARVAELLAEGKVVALARGRMEFGPRALGNRSILADPRSASMQRLLNEAVKKRESFRPFAPAVLDREASAWFAPPFGSPFMTVTAPLRDEHRLPLPGPVPAGVQVRLAQRRSPVPAVTHVDFSARPQLVSPQSPLWPIVERFEELTSVPMVVNTSFNLRGEPVVCSPLDALRCFAHSRIDVLVLGDALVEASAVASCGVPAPVTEAD